MTLAPILYHALHLIIAKQMSSLLTQKSKFKSDNCISMQMLTTDNEGFQTTTAKNGPLNNGATYASENSKPFSPISSTKRLYSCRSKHINENKNDNKLFGPVNSTKRLRGRGNKHVGKDSKNNDSGSQTVTALPTASTKHLIKCKTAYAAVYNNLSKKTEMLTPATTIGQLRSDSISPVILTGSIHSHMSKHIKTKSNANSLAKSSPYISSTQHLRYQQSRRTEMESDSNESSTDEKTDRTLSVISTQRLHKRNNNCIDIIKSIRKKTKTPLWIFAKN